MYIEGGSGGGGDGGEQTHWNSSCHDPEHNSCPLSFPMQQKALEPSLNMLIRTYTQRIRRGWKSYVVFLMLSEVRRRAEEQNALDGNKLHNHTTRTLGQYEARSHATFSLQFNFHLSLSLSLLFSAVSDPELSEEFPNLNLYSKFNSNIFII